MASLAQLHNQLVEQLQQKHLLDNPSLVMAFSAVPRHLFLPHIHPANVYQDKAIALKVSPSGETLSSSSQPTMMAIMLQQLELDAGLNVLEIGTASGYNAAIMKHIVGDSGDVTSLEIDSDLAGQARGNLVNAGCAQVLVVNCDGASGYEPRAKYDRIMATVGVQYVPVKWLMQLEDSGRLVVPIWLNGIQMSAAFVPEADGTFLSRDNRPCAFVRLRGMAAGACVQRRVGDTSLVILADEMEKIDTAALQALLSDDFRIHRLCQHLRAEDYWHGFQLYLMLHAPEESMFAVYSMPPEQKVRGLEGNGMMLFLPGSAAFAGYEHSGAVHSFGADDAFLKMLSLFEEWRARTYRYVERLRLRLIPLQMGAPSIPSGRLYKRKDHYLHVWQV